MFTTTEQQYISAAALVLKLQRQLGVDRVRTTILAKEMGLKIDYAQELYSVLNKAGIIKTWRGVKGGISVVDVNMQLSDVVMAIRLIKPPKRGRGALDYVLDLVLTMDSVSLEFLEHYTLDTISAAEVFGYGMPNDGIPVVRRKIKQLTTTTAKSGAPLDYETARSAKWYGVEQNRDRKHNKR